MVNDDETLVLGARVHEARATLLLLVIGQPVVLRRLSVTRTTCAVRAADGFRFAMMASFFCFSSSLNPLRSLLSTCIGSTWCSSTIIPPVKRDTFTATMLSLQYLK